MYSSTYRQRKSINTKKIVFQIHPIFLKDISIAYVKAVAITGGECKHTGGEFGLLYNQTSYHQTINVMIIIIIIAN